MEFKWKTLNDLIQASTPKDADLLMVHDGTNLKKITLQKIREFITNGSITLNDEKITDVGFTVTKDVCIDGKFIIIRRGKKNYYIGVFE